MSIRKIGISLILVLLFACSGFARTVNGNNYQVIKGIWHLVDASGEYEVDYSVIVVKYTSSATSNDIAKFNSNNDMSIQYTTNAGYAVLEFLSAADPLDMIETYLASTLVQSAEVNIYGKWATEDTYYDNQWHLPSISCDLAWTYTTGDPSVVISIIDSGIDMDHSDLDDNLWVNTEEATGEPDDDDDNNGYLNDINGWDFESNDNDPSAVFYHGTHVAGIAAAETYNGLGVAGIAGGWNGVGGCRLQILKVGNTRPSALNTSNAIAYADTTCVDIISLSLSLGENSIDYVDAEIEDAYNHGIFINCSSGNWDPYVTFPASHKNVIAVGAIDYNNYKTRESNCGTGLTVVAPGENIKSALLNNSYGMASGTSMASPMVAGLAGLLLSYDASYTNEDIAMIICRSAEKIREGNTYNYNVNGEYGTWSDEVGYGKINALYAVAEPDVPTSLSVSGGQGDSPTLSWTASQALDVKEYVVKRVMETFSSTVTHYITVTSSPWTDNEVVIDNSGGLDITYRVKAKDYSDQVSAYSSSVSIEYDGGIWKTVPGIDDSVIPTEFALRDPYPSPFNAMTNIQFDVPETSDIKISVYNTQGQLIEDLVNATYSPGTHKVSWQAGNHSSGAYFVQLRANNFRAMKRLVLIK